MSLSDMSSSAPMRLGRLFKKPDMDDRRRQLDMAHALAAYFGLDDFDTALLADYAAMAHAFILAAVAFVILGRTKNLGAK